MQKFNISESENIFKLLSRRIYSRPDEAVIRELVANGIDASENPIVEIEYEILFDEDTNEESGVYFSFKDNGVGLSKEGLSIFSTFFDSTKGENEIGGFGLGAKTPFAVSKEFIVETIHKGKKNKVRCFINEEGFPYMQHLISDEHVTEASGTKIYFITPLNVGHDIISSLKKFYWDYLDADIYINNLMIQSRELYSNLLSAVPEELKDLARVRMGSNIYIDCLRDAKDANGNSLFSNRDKSFFSFERFCLVDGFAFDLPDGIKEKLKKRIEDHQIFKFLVYSFSLANNALENIGIDGEKYVPYFKGNEVTINPSREFIESDEKTVETVIDKVIKILLYQKTGDILFAEKMERILNKFANGVKELSSKKEYLRSTVVFDVDTLTSKILLGYSPHKGKSILTEEESLFIETSSFFKYRTLEAITKKLLDKGVANVYCVNDIVFSRKPSFEEFMYITRKHLKKEEYDSCFFGQKNESFFTSDEIKSCFGKDAICFYGDTEGEENDSMFKLLFVEKRVMGLSVTEIAKQSSSINSFLGFKVNFLGYYSVFLFRDKEDYLNYLIRAAIMRSSLKDMVSHVAVFKKYSGSLPALKGNDFFNEGNILNYFKNIKIARTTGEMEICFVDGFPGIIELKKFVSNEGKISSSSFVLTLNKEDFKDYMEAFPMFPISLKEVQLSTHLKKRKLPGMTNLKKMFSTKRSKSSDKQLNDKIIGTVYHLDSKDNFVMESFSYNSLQKIIDEKGPNIFVYSLSMENPDILVNDDLEKILQIKEFLQNNSFDDVSILCVSFPFKTAKKLLELENELEKLLYSKMKEGVNIVFECKASLKQMLDTFSMSVESFLLKQADDEVFEREHKKYEAFTAINALIGKVYNIKKYMYILISKELFYSETSTSGVLKEKISLALDGEIKSKDDMLDSLIVQRFNPYINGEFFDGRREIIQYVQESGSFDQYEKDLICNAILENTNYSSIFIFSLKPYINKGNNSSSTYFNLFLGLIFDANDGREVLKPIIDKVSKEKLFELFVEEGKSLRFDCIPIKDFFEKTETESLLLSMKDTFREYFKNRLSFM